MLKVQQELAKLKAMLLLTNDIEEKLEIESQILKLQYELDSYWDEIYQLN